MKPNTAKKILARREVSFGSWVTLVSSPRIMKIYAAAGFDFAIIDLEHTDFSSETVAALVMMARECGLAPLFRPAGMRPHDMSRPLDAGAMGLILPGVETVDDVKAAIRATMYYPHGKRILQLRSVHTDFDSSDPAGKVRFTIENFLLIAMIESERGLDNLDAICAIPEVDVVMIGPDDLSQDLGIPGQTRDKRVLTAMDRVIAACERHGKVSGITVHDRDTAKMWLDKGVRFMPYTNDTAALVRSSTEGAAIMRELTGRG